MAGFSGVGIGVEEAAIVQPRRMAIQGIPDEL
jgi:hypothetical protein